MAKTLEREIAAFEKHRLELEATHSGKFVLIHGDEVAGVFDTFENAAGEGLRRYGEQEFLIRQVGAPEPKLSPAILYGLARARNQNRTTRSK